MNKEISVKQVKNAFANEKTGIKITLFRHEVLLTKEEAKELFDRLEVALWGLYIPKE